jgi:excisionase family DNA binding protein
MIDPDDLPTLTVPAIVARLGLPRSTVYLAIADGRLPHHRFGARGGTIRISESQLRAFLARTSRHPKTWNVEVIRPTTPTPAAESRALSAIVQARRRPGQRP